MEFSGTQVQISKVSISGVVLLSPSTSEFQGPETWEGKLVRQQSSSLQICLSGKLIPCSHTDTMENFKKGEMTVFPSLWQAAKKYIHGRVKWSSSWSPAGEKLFLSKWARVVWLVLALSSQHSLQVLPMELSGVRLPICIHPFLFPGKWPINCFDQIKFWHLVQNRNFQAFQAWIP